MSEMADKIEHVLKKHSKDWILDLRSMETRMRLISGLAMVAVEESMRVLENISRGHTLLSMSHKHYMIKAPECLGDREREEKCESCTSRRLCDVVVEWEEDNGNK